MCKARFKPENPTRPAVLMPRAKMRDEERNIGRNMHICNALE